MSPLYVRPYVKVHKNDDRDAEAIAEAATLPTMSFVAIKSEEQLDLQALHRARERLVTERTRLINQVARSGFWDMKTGKQFVSRFLPSEKRDSATGRPRYAIDVAAPYSPKGALTPVKGRHPSAEPTTADAARRMTGGFSGTCLGCSMVFHPPAEALWTCRGLMPLL